MSTYTLSPAARNDLIVAGSYAAKKSGSERIGAQVIDRLATAMEKLAQFPMMGKPRDEVRPHLRSFPSKPFIIFYRRTRTGIHVMRILHQRQDLRNAFPERRR